MKRCWVRQILVLALVFGLISAASASQDSAALRQSLLQLHNAQRAKAGKAPLQLNEELTAAAQNYADYLAQSGKFSHDAKGSPGSRVREAGFSWRMVGENIAKGQRSAETVVAAWMHSPGHRANILGPGYTQVGFGVARSKHGAEVWVTDFGTPMAGSAHKSHRHHKHH